MDKNHHSRFLLSPKNIMRVIGFRDNILSTNKHRKITSTAYTKVITN